MEVPALRLNEPADRVMIGAFPFADRNESGRGRPVGPSEDERRFARRLLECQDLDELVVQAEMVPVAFQDRAAGLKIDVRVVGQIDALDFVRRVVEQAAQRSESSLFIQHIDVDELPKLRCENGGACRQLLPGPVKIGFEQIDLSWGQERGSKGRARTREPGRCSGSRSVSLILRGQRQSRFQAGTSRGLQASRFGRPWPCGPPEVPNPRGRCGHNRI